MALQPGQKLTRDMPLFGNRAIYALTDDATLKFGKSATGAYRTDVYFYGSTASSYLHLDSSADTLYKVGVTEVKGAASATISNGDGTTNLIPGEQINGTTKATGSMLISVSNTTNDTTVAPSLNFLKNGNAAISGNTVVASGEILGEITAFGADGADFESPAARVSFEVDNTAGAGDMPGRIVMSTTADSGETLTEALRIDSAQDVRVNNGSGLIVGSTSAQVTISDGDGSTNLIPEVQVLGTGKADSSIVLGSFSATATSAAAPSLNFLKSAHATLGSNTIVTNADVLGEINFFGADGVDFESAGARIYAKMDGLTPGAGDMPAKLVIQTSPDGSETLADRLTVASTGAVTIAAATTPASVAGTPGTNSAAALTVTGGVGGATSIATTGTGGNGGGLTVTLGAGGAAAAAATASTGGNGGAFAVTTGAGAEASVAGAGNMTGGNGGAITLLTGDGGATGTASGTNLGGTSGSVSITTGTGGAAANTGTDTGGASGSITIATGTGGAGDTGGASGTITIQTGAVGAGGSPAVGGILIKPGTNEKWRFDSTGNFSSAGALTNVTADGAVLATGGISMTDVLNAWIDDASHGDGTTTHYIGNQAITTASDKRLKKNIHDTVRDAHAIINSLRVVDFDWDDPTDRHSPYGKHSRGTYMGMIAQEMIESVPWAVNAPGESKHCSACKAGQPCREHSEQYWFAEYEYIVPPLVKAYQTMSARLAAIEAKLGL